MSRWTWPLVGLVGVLVVATGGYAVAQSRDDGPTYRTAAATLGSVQRTLDLSGTVTATGLRNLSFGASGAVSRVDVSAGRHVTRGQVLARLDPTALDATVTQAVATLAKARAQLASDESAQVATLTAATVSTSTAAHATGKANTQGFSKGSSKGSSGSGKPKSTGGSGKGGSGGSGSGGTGSGGSNALHQGITQLKRAQQAVINAQEAVDAAIATATSALDAARAACVVNQPDPSSDPSSSPSSSSSGDPSSDQPSTAPSGSSTACSGALDVVGTDLSGVQSTLRQAITTLGTTLGDAVTALTSAASGSSGGSGGGSGGSSGGSGGSSGGSSGGGSSHQASAPKQGTTGTGGSSSSQGSSYAGGTSRGGAETVTASRLAQDQAAIDVAGAQLTVARVARGTATLRAPYAGTVLAVSTTKGDQVGASDSVVTLRGKGVTTVTTTVSTAQVPQVRRNQRVRVTPAGWATSLTGRVSAIGLLPDSSGAFPVTVTVESDKPVAEGTTATLAVVTGAATDVVTVPTSALTQSGTGGGRSSVEVLSGGTVTTTAVTVGIVGPARTAISRGLKAGQRVVLADLAATIPTTTSTQGGPGGGGGIGVVQRRFGSGAGRG